MQKYDPARSSVKIKEELLTFPTYEPFPPDKNPMFLDRRVYQGSSGKVYPLPVYNRIDEKRTPRKWKAISIENEFIEVMVLPEIGGRIHIGKDKTNGYDFFYRQNVIKPALVGLNGPWASGGVEFNWPQHHRPATFMPVDTEIEEHEDGSKTIWMSDHDPLLRMKGMHGVCLHPGRAVLELKVRAYNRTPFVQNFLWWANVGTRVHEGYQSFFPPDVSFVADHAKRATSRYPLCEDKYYGVDYGSRARKGVPSDEAPSQFVPPHLLKAQNKPLSETQKAIPPYAANDLTWYANIPVPTSYMCVGSKENFVGGYDHIKKAGLVHVANPHISPGKKQWTWGNQEFGYAWDRNLTDDDGPYIELMAGVYTDNQPDFSFLQPGETKTWSQFWYPIQQMGPAHKANTLAAASLQLEKNQIQIGVSPTQVFESAQIELFLKEKLIKRWSEDLAPGKPFVGRLEVEPKSKPEQFLLKVTAKDGTLIISYQPQAKKIEPLPEPATEPPLPEQVKSNDELYIIGLHLNQYTHATRFPEAYWQEAIKRDAGDSRCHNALGLRYLRRGEFSKARTHFEAALKRLTSRNPNPYDGEPSYNLGLVLRLLGHHDEAYTAFYKSTWNQAWQSAGYHALAELDCLQKNWTTAIDHADQSLRLNTDNLSVRNLKTMALRQLGQSTLADQALKETLSLDPLDSWARYLVSGELPSTAQTGFDIALDQARCGFFTESIELLSQIEQAYEQNYGSEYGQRPLIYYYLGWLCTKANDAATAPEFFVRAARAPADYCFPFRLEEIEILQAAMTLNKKDSKAPYYLGNLLYDKNRRKEAIQMWEQSVTLDSSFATAWRNLGIGYFNFSQKPAKAVLAFNKAVACDPNDARLLYERDQLAKRLKQKPQKRLRELEKNTTLAFERDDLAVELCALYNQTGRSSEALQIITQRQFQPWEGGEGLALGQHVRTHLILGRQALKAKDYKKALEFFEIALKSPSHLGEAKHLLANQSEIHYWLGRALQGLGHKTEAHKHWKKAANSQGDFQQMSVRQFSEATFTQARSLEELGQKLKAQKLYRDLFAYSKRLYKSTAHIDYFATSLPTMLLFEDDLQNQQETEALFLQALAEFGLKRRAAALHLLRVVLKREPSHAAAADFITALEISSTK